MDYSNLGLDSQLRSVNSPSSGTTIQALNFESNYQVPTGFIDHANIKDFNFSQGAGGTLTLGGTLNGDGLMVVNNAAGSPVVTLNNTGISVTDGSISIQNSSGSTILDSAGLYGINNFVDIAVTAPLGTVTGTSWVNATGGTLAPIIVTRTTPVFYTFRTYGFQSNVWNDSGYNFVSIFEGTTEILRHSVSGIDIGGSVLFGQDLYSGYFSQITAGTHIYNIKVRNDTSTSTGVYTAFLNVTKYGT